MQWWIEMSRWKPTYEERDLRREEPEAPFQKRCAEDRGLAPHVKKQGGTTCGAKPAKTVLLMPQLAELLAGACYR